MADPSSQDPREKPPHERLAELETEFQSSGKEFIDLSDQIYVLEKKLRDSSELVFNRGVSVNIQTEEADAKSLELLKERYEKSKQKSDDLLFEINEIYRRHPKVEDFEKLIFELSVIVFVNEIEKADQYFDLKHHLRSKVDFIKHDSTKEDVINIIRGNPILMDKYNKLDGEVMRHAVAAVIREVSIEYDRRVTRPRYINYLKELNSEKWLNCTTYSDEDYEKMAGSWSWLNLNEREKDDYAYMHPILRLVFKTREKQNVMARYPKEELEKIRMLDSVFYEHDVMYEFPREEFEKIRTSNVGTPLQDIEVVVREELFKDALDRYDVFRTKYSAEDIDQPAKDEAMVDNSWERAFPIKDDGESLPPDRSLEFRSVRREELFKDALDRYDVFRTKYSAEDIDQPAKDEAMVDNSWERAFPIKDDGESLPPDRSSELRSVRPRIQV